jgi:hypothetical protein
MFAVAVVGVRMEESNETGNSKERPHIQCKD